MNGFTFFDNKESLSNSEPLITSRPVKADSPDIINQIPEQHLRYRCEQTVVVKQAGVIKTHAEAKREFLVKKTNTGSGGTFLYDVSMVDSVISFYPASKQDMMNLMSAIDNIKCGALIKPNATTGKIEAILNINTVYE